jgi:hypothetical protein
MAALIISAVQPTARAEPYLPCWIQLVQQQGQRIDIQFVPNHQPLFITTEAQEWQDKTSSKQFPDNLIMQEGEAADVGDGLHSGCKMTVERREGQLGLQLKTYVSLPGLPTDVRTEFIPATPQVGSQSQR